MSEILLINTNRMQPAIAPLGLEYVAAAARAAGLDVAVLDLCWADDPAEALRRHLLDDSPRLVGLTFRNVDDCFRASGRGFADDLAATARQLRELTDAPVLLGGVGFSVMPRRLLEHAGADFGIHGDGEIALVALYRELTGRRDWSRVPGLLWRADGEIHANAPAWPAALEVPTARDALDNARYFAQGGQCGIETKRACGRNCLYCVDPLAKGPNPRLRPPADVATEVAGLADRGIDVLHLCDAEFNLPREHALAVCTEFVRRGLGRRLRWYAYLATTPFDAELAHAMARAGCVGINFTADSASEAMLAAYRQPHRRQDIAAAVRLCREHGIAAMLDLMLGGPGETPATARETIDAVRRIAPDCAGVGLGLRIYPGTPLLASLEARGPLEDNPEIERSYPGRIDLLHPTFYTSRHLGQRPAAMLREIIAGDPLFFPPADPEDLAGGDHNYNDNEDLVAAIRSGARGAYWDILRHRPTPPAVAPNPPGC